MYTFKNSITQNKISLEYGRYNLSILHSGNTPRTALVHHIFQRFPDTLSIHRVIWEEDLGVGTCPVKVTIIQLCVFCSLWRKKGRWNLFNFDLAFWPQVFTIPKYGKIHIVWHLRVGQKILSDAISVKEKIPDVAGPYRILKLPYEQLKLQPVLDLRIR